MNTTYLSKNNLKVTADGSVIVLGKGRRTITTANAYQKMVKPSNGGLSCWNDFVRVYTDELSTLKYSSLLVGQWDTLTQAGGDNVRLNGVFKTAHGVIVVGRHNATGNELPLANVPAWGNSNFNGESAVLAYLQATNLYDPNDSPVDFSTGTAVHSPDVGLSLWPNPSSGIVHVQLSNVEGGTLELLDLSGRRLRSWPVRGGASAVALDMRDLSKGSYLVVHSQHIGKRSSARLVLR